MPVDDGVFHDVSVPAVAGTDVANSLTDEPLTGLTR